MTCLVILLSARIDAHCETSWYPIFLVVARVQTTPYSRVLFSYEVWLQIICVPSRRALWLRDGVTFYFIGYTAAVALLLLLYYSSTIHYCF